MSEPYEGAECLACGSFDTGSYNAATAATQGIFAESVADMACSGIKA